nr:hypothetical protein Iba_scaffold32287CG0030 [Ipomoea batatas]GMC78252.1 hypothetical protein Iba_scaffold830884CG0010 [Ipomoea batatas]GMC93307.1 hypothetical protein Iba_chr05bCG1130 [Ipomoea batatas]GMC98967.1 hypothetical protein Iba_chr05eCG1220 [Ipomoea batatas]
MKMRGWWASRWRRGRALTAAEWFKPWMWRASGASAFSQSISRTNADITALYVLDVWSSNKSLRLFLVN